MTREIQIVITLCATPLTDSARANARPLITDAVDWDRVFKVAALFEVEPVFFANLISLDDADIPAEVLDRAAIAERDARAFALARTLLLVDLYRKLEATGVSVLVLKGPAIGVMGYDDPSMRTYGDIDLLTTREDLTRARDLLLGLGYARDYDSASESSLIRGGHALEFSGPGSKVELHTELVERHLGFDLGNEEVWRDAITVKCAGADIKVLDRARLLLFVCAHGTKHEWIRVRWICDVAQVADRLDSIDVAHVVALAERAHASGILGLGLGLAREVLGRRFPHFRFFRSGESARTGSAINYVQRRLGLIDAAPPPAGWLERLDSNASSLVFWARSRERFIDRLGAFVRVVFVPSETDRSMGSLGWITRPARLTSRLLTRALSLGWHNAAETESRGRRR